jgi:heme-degrading monooxygenase HmoA
MPTPIRPVTLIEAFEVPPEADEAFIDGWERLAAADGGTTAALHRALRVDAELRFVAVAQVDAPAIGDPEVPGRELPFTTHASVYEVVHEDGEPGGAGGAVLINPFEVPAGADERFLTGWHRARDVLAARPGYLCTRLHRSVAPADFRFVNIARWSSPLAFARALQRPEFQQTAAAMPFASHPALYQVVRA